MVARNGDAGRVDLGEAGVTEKSPAAMRAPDGARIAPLRIGTQVEDIAVATGGENDRIGDMALNLAGDHIAGDDPPSTSIDQH